MKHSETRDNAPDSRDVPYVVKKHINNNNNNNNYHVLNFKTIS